MSHWFKRSQVAGWCAGVLLVLGGLVAVPQSASAQSTYPGCATRAVSVTHAGAVVVDLTACQVGFGLGPISTAPQHGVATFVEPAGAPKMTVRYTHNGDSATSDVFVVRDDSNRTITVNVTITGAASPISISPSALPALTAGQALNQTFSSTGGAAPYTYSVDSGALVPGLSLSSSGLLSGTPTQRGSYAFSLRSQDSTGANAVRSFAGAVANPGLSLAASSATATQSQAFTFNLSAVGGVAPHSYVLESGSFPAGISLSSSGVVSGTTSAATGSYPVTVRVTDASTPSNAPYFELETFTLTVTTAPSVSISVSPASVVEDAADLLRFTVTRSSASASPLVVNLTSSGTATSGSDYTGFGSSVTIAGGASSATVTVDPTADAAIEPDETVTLTVASGSGYTVGAPASATGTLLNDDVLTASIAVSPASVVEDGAANLVYTITLNQPAPSATAIGFGVSGTATAESDYAAVTSPVTIAAGASTATVTVNPTADATIEPDETVILTLASGAGYSVGAPSAATGTLANDDLPTLSINDVTLAEGASGTTLATFSVSLSAPAGPGGVSFDVATANGTATAGIDYVARSLAGQTIAAGASAYTVSVSVNGDALNETNETFSVTIGNVTGAVVGDGQGLGTITNDDPVPGLSIDDATLVEGNSGSADAVFTVTLDSASGQTVTVSYATVDGTATAGADFTATTGTLTFAPGQITATVSVPILGDATSEGIETFSVALSGAVNANLLDPTGAGTITDDDTASVSIAVSPASMLEDAAGTLAFTVTRSAASIDPLTVNLAAGGTATSGTDYIGATASVTIAANATTATVIIDPTADSAVEPDETVILTLSPGAGYSVGAPASASATLANDDAVAASVAVSPVSVSEDGSAVLVYTVTLTQPAPSALSIGYGLSGAATAGVDYGAVGGSIAIPAGGTTGTVTIDPTADITIEPDETVILTLTAGAGYVIGAPNAASGTIANDDAPTLTVNDVAVTEGDAGTAAATFTVALSAPAPAGGVTFDIQTANNTAIGGQDYVARALTAQSIAAGASTYAFTVQINGDLIDEADETFFVNLSAVSGASLGDAQGLGTITDDDAPPTLNISSPTVIEGNAGNVDVGVAFTLTAASSRPVTANWATGGGTASAGSDYTAASGSLSFAPGEVTKTVLIPIVGDTVVEADETFTVGFANAPTFATGGPAGVVTIQNDDQVALTINDVSQAEGGAGATSFVFTVALSAPAPAGGVTFDIATGPGTAAAGSDYVTNSATARTIPAGASSATFAVIVNGDALNEADETFFVNVSNVLNAQTVDGQGLGTIVNDDAVPSLSVNDITLVEGDAGTTAAVFTVTLSVASGGPVTVDFATADGTATAGADYVAQSGVLTFAPGVTARTVSVSVNGDIAIEPAETFTIGLSGATNASIVDASGSATILADDVAPRVLSLTPTSGLRAGGTAVTLTGVGFTGATAVGFGVTAASSFVVDSDTQIRAVTPAGLGTVDVSVTTAKGVSTPSVATRYAYVGSSVSGLSSLVVSQGSLAPAFTSSALSYTVAVAADVTAITVTPTAIDPAAVVRVNGAVVGSGAASQPIALAVGATAVSVIVTAEDGVTTTAYSVQVSRAPASVSTLSDLTLSSGALSPAFASGTTAYTAAVPNAIASVTLTPTVTDASATVTVNGVSVNSGGASGPIALSVGGNPITIVVTAQDGVTTTTYSTVVTRTGSAVSSLSNLVLSTGALTPAFAPGMLSYTASVPNGTSAITVTPTATDAAAALSVNGASVVSGAPSSPLALAVGPTTVTIGVTAPDGVTRSLYSVVVGRAEAAPVAGPVSASVAYNAGATPIPLALSGGPTTSVRVATSPSHGTVVVSGSSLTYQPVAGFAGLDSFTYGATGPGGASEPASVTVSVGGPTLQIGPSALAAGQRGLPYTQALTASGGQGPYEYSVAAGGLPNGLSLSSNGVLAGAPEVAGAFGFSVRVTDSSTGAGPFSTVQAYVLTVAPPALTLSPAAGGLPDATLGAPYSQTFLASGGAAPYAIAVTAGALPPGLSLSSAGVLSGTPSADGDFSFTVTVTDSAAGVGPATASQAYGLRVAPPPPPTVRPPPAAIEVGGGPDGGQPTRIDLTALVSGDFDAIRVATPPQHGSVVLEVGSASAPLSAPSASTVSSVGARPQVTAVYTPATGYVGADGFAFVAVGRGGTSAPATVSIRVLGQTPTASHLVATTEQGRPVTLDLSGAASGGPFTAAALVSATPATAATMTLAEGGVAGARTYLLTVTPRADFEGEVIIRYTISNSAGVSLPATVTLTVQPRPNPAADPTVRGLSTAQAQAARLFATTQLGNFNRRNEQLHGATEGQGQTFGLSLSGGRSERPDGPLGDLPWAERERQLRFEREAGLSPHGGVGGGIDRAARAAGEDRSSTVPGDGAAGGGRAVGEVSTWTGGAVAFGAFDDTRRSAGFEITTAGVSGGADVKLNDQLILGAGGGFATQRTELEVQDAGRLEGESWTGALYGSWRPNPGVFIDGVLGYGALDMTVWRRASNGRIATGDREGETLMGSLTTGWDHVRPSGAVSLYGRLDYASTTLDAYTENGAELADLAFAARDLNSLVGALGVRGRVLRPLRSGVLSRTGRLEWRHEFSALDGQRLDYVGLGSLRYAIEGERWMQDELAAEFGLELTYESGLILGLDAGASVSDVGQSATLRLLLTKRF